jgi:hypothetical protein
MQTCEQVELIETAYSLDVPNAQWQYRLTDLVAERWGGSAASFLYDASGPGEVVCERVMIRKAGERSIVDTPRSIPLTDPVLGRALFATRPHLAQLVDLAGPELTETEDCKRVLQVVGDLRPGPFSVVLRTLDASRKGLFFALPSRPIGDRMRVMWEQVAVHMGLAYRLRCALSNASGGAGQGRVDPGVLRRALRQAAQSVPQAPMPAAAGSGKLGGTTRVDLVRVISGQLKAIRDE